MMYDRTTSAEPIRYTAATMEMMRLEDLQHVRCGVHYAADHSYGHLAPQIHKKYFAEKEWANKDAIKTKILNKKFENQQTRQHIFAKAERALRTPFASEGNEFFAHKEASCMAFVNEKGKKRADCTGFDETHGDYLRQSMKKSRGNAAQRAALYGKLQRPTMGKTGSTAASTSRRPHSAQPMSRSNAGSQASFVSRDEIDACARRVAKTLSQMSRSGGSRSASQAGSRVGGSSVAGSQVTSRSRDFYADKSVSAMSMGSEYKSEGMFPTFPTKAPKPKPERFPIVKGVMSKSPPGSSAASMSSSFKSENKSPNLFPTKYKPKLKPEQFPLTKGRLSELPKFERWTSKTPGSKTASTSASQRSPQPSDSYVPSVYPTDSEYTENIHMFGYRRERHVSEREMMKKNGKKAGFLDAIIEEQKNWKPS